MATKEKDAAAAEQIYVIRCQHGKFYVGSSGDPLARFAEHVAGYGAAWTRLHAPMELVRTIPKRSPADESRVTEELMRQHGIEQVRGAEYTQVELPDWQQKGLEQKFKHIDGKCFKCGESGHFAAQCSEQASPATTRSFRCFRCGKLGHFASACPQSESDDEEEDSQSD